MPRPRRLEPAGVALHVIQHGNNREACFFEDSDRYFYLKCLAEYAERRGCAVHAYALMTNHVHLLVTPAEEGGVSLMLQDIGRRFGGKHHSTVIHAIQKIEQKRAKEREFDRLMENFIQSLQ